MSEFQSDEAKYATWKAPETGASLETGPTDDVRARTFAEARALPKQISEQVVLGMINDTARFSLKNYLDRIPPNDIEKQIGKSPEFLGTLHEELAMMIAENVRLVGFISNDEKQIVDRQGAHYVARLKDDAQNWAESVKRLSQHGQSNDDLGKTADYHGFVMPTAQGEIDISRFGKPGLKNMRPNITVQQNEYNGEQFVHWDSDKSLEKKLRSEPHQLSKRIYINPRTPELVRIFTHLMRKLNQEGIAVHGKVWDRSTELVKGLRDELPPVRADAIVLALEEQDADKVLSMVLELVQKNPAVFTDRPTPRIPTRIAPGVAVGDEPLAQGTSLTAHREELISQAVTETKNRLGLKPWQQIDQGNAQLATAEFHKVFVAIAQNNNVDPNNLAFNV